MSMNLQVPADVPPYLVEQPGQEPSYLARQIMVVVTVVEPATNAPSSLIVTKEWMPSSTKSRPFEYKIGTFGRIMDPLDDEPLNARAWTLQERLLAPRTLHYGSNQVFWECSEGLLAEDGTPFPATFLSLNSLLRSHRIGWIDHGLPSGSGGQLNLIEGLYDNVPRHGRWDGGWLALVQNYSRRLVTKPDDRLPALAGLARILADRTGDRYLAGLWYSHIEEDLCWRVYAREEMKIGGRNYGSGPETLIKRYGRTLSAVGRPAKYRAPSWSWASVDASVLFMQLNFDHIVVMFEGGYVEPVGKDMYGQLKAAWIQLKVSYRVQGFL
jgi:hypothetical protein